MTNMDISTNALGFSSSRDPHAEARTKYYEELVAEGFPASDAQMIAQKTNFNSRTMQAGRELQPLAIADFFGNLPKPKTISKHTQVRSDAQAVLDARAAEAAAPKVRKRPPDKPLIATYDYNRYEDLPPRVRDLIEAHLAIEAADARAAGTLGFMTRALAIATLRIGAFRTIGSFAKMATSRSPC